MKWTLIKPSVRYRPQKALTNRISSFHDNIDAVQVSEFDVSVAEKEQDEVNSRLEILRNELVEAKFEDRIKEHIAKIRELEDKRDSLNSDLTMLNKQADTRAKLSLKRSEIQNKREGIQAL